MIEALLRPLALACHRLGTFVSVLADGRAPIITPLHTLLKRTRQSFGRELYVLISPNRSLVLCTLADSKYACVKPLLPSYGIGWEGWNDLYHQGFRIAAVTLLLNEDQS